MSGDRRSGDRPLAVVISLDEARARLVGRAKRRHPSSSAAVDVVDPPRPGGDAA